MAHCGSLWLRSQHFLLRIKLKLRHNSGSAGRSAETLKSDISRFNVDCAASTGLYEAAAGAFGDSGAGGDGDVGECPAASLAPEECAGAVSNCWSPGQRDTGEARGRVQARLDSNDIPPL